MTEIKKRNQYEYDKKKYDHIHLQVEKGTKEDVKSHAGAMGESLNAFIKRAITETMEHDRY